MGFKDITAGKKLARVAAARFVNSQKGTLGIEVAFRFKQGEVEERIQWVGWCTADAIQRTMKTLVEVLGFNGDDSVDPSTKFLKATALDMNRDVELVIEMQTYEGKTHPRVSWVNNPNSAGGFESPGQNQISAQLSAVGFKAAFLAAKQTFAGGAAVTQPVAAELSPEEVPF